MPRRAPRAPGPGGWTCRLLLALGLAVGLAAAQQPAAGGALVGGPPMGTVRWRAGPAWRPSRTAAETAAVLAATLARGDGSHLVVQLDGPPTRATRQRLAAAGLELGAPLGGGAAFAWLRTARLDVAALLDDPELLGVAPVDPAWKRHPDLAGGATPARAVLAPGDDPLVAAYLVAHRDVPLARVGAAVQARGGRVVSALPGVHGLVLELSRGALDQLVELDAVQWVEPPLPPLADLAAPFNDSNRVITQVEQVRAAPYELDGAGVSVMVYDGGAARAGHVDFGGRLSVRDGSAVSDHATHVSATLGGSGAAGGGALAGMAPGVTLQSYGYQYDGSGTYLYTNPGDFAADCAEATDSFGAALVNASIGSNVESSGFACNLQGDYGVMGAVLDGLVAGASGAPQRLVWAAGNERQGERCDVEGFGDYYSLAPPAAAKNPLCVGALDSVDDDMTGFSSWGPTDDGRMKPDLCAPGCQSGGDGGVSSAGAASDTAVSVKCGTSMAAPTAAGCVALLLQDQRARLGGPDPLPSTVKALLVHTAADRCQPGPDHQSGYGSIRIRDGVDQLRSGRWSEGQLDDQGARAGYELVVVPGTPSLRLTLAWDDAPGTPNVLAALVNDLDLVVSAPDGTRHFPWTLDPAAPAAPAVRDGPNRLDNLEQVLVASPQAGTWRVEVTGHAVASGPQRFSLVSSEALLVEAQVDIGFPDGLPTTVVPGLPTALPVRVTPGAQGLLGSPRLHTRPRDAVGFTSVALAHVAGDLWQANLPAFACGDSPEFFVEALGASSGPATSPATAPQLTHGVSVQQTSVLANFDMQDGLGWSSDDAAVSAGGWVRGVPAGDGGRNDPLADFDGSGACWLTGNGPHEDLDGGPARLTSPPLDLSAASGVVTLQVAVWMANDDFDADALVLELSGDGGASWTTAEVLGNTNGWSLRSLRPADFVALGPDVRLRATVSDSPNDSITEAALDALTVLETRCEGPDPWTDLGSALAGVVGPPRLAGHGPLTAGSANSVALSAAAPGAHAVVFVSLSEQPVPFKGGTLLTVPVTAGFGLITDAAGAGSLGFAWPGGVPSGVTVSLQAAVVDAAAPQGVALSNGLRGSAP